MLSTEAETAVGVLKMNSRILEPAELKRLDKQEKGQVTEVQTTGKGKKEGREVWREGKLTCDHCFESEGHHLESYTIWKSLGQTIVRRRFPISDLKKGGESILALSSGQSGWGFPCVVSTLR